MLKVLVFLFFITLSQSSQLPSISVKGNHFVDEYGRIRFFHGTNRVQKSFPWYQEDLVTISTSIENFAKYGLNVVRLGFMWSGYEPQENQFNETYLENIKTIIENLASKGIYTLLDMHQDVLSSKFCLYDGVPLWVINKSHPALAFPLPLLGSCKDRFWLLNTVSEACSQAYQDIYDNTNGMQDNFKAFWKQTAKQFKSSTNVIGYELINEPFAGNFFKDPSLLLPGVGGSKNLQPLYNNLASVIRQEDEQHIIFYEPVIWGMIQNGKEVGSGFTHVPGGDDYKNRSAFSYHYYCDEYVLDWEHHPFWKRQICDKTIGPNVFKAVKKDVSQIGGASFMTEFGDCFPENNKTIMEECGNVMNNADAYLQSWTDWTNTDMIPFNPPSQWVEYFSRTYPQAVSGNPLNMTFDVNSKAFEFCFEIDQSITQPTEIYYNHQMYGDALQIQVTDNLTFQKQGDNYVYVLAKKEKLEKIGCVKINKKSIIVS